MQSPRSRLVRLLGVVLVVASALPAPMARAATFTVTDAPGLIAALNTANSNNADDVIVLGADIVLTAVDNTADGQNGLPSIGGDSGHSLILDGQGHTLSRSGATAFRILHVASGATLTLRHIRIQNGLASAGGLGTLGAGLYSAGTLTVERSVFASNTATTSSGLGAGIFINQGATTLTESTFTGNTGAMGVGVYAYQATVHLTGNTFTGNSGTSGGAALANETGTVTLTNNTFSNNQSLTAYGGAVYQLGGSAVLTNNTLTGNSAGQAGGALYNLAGTMTLRNNIISGNTAPSNPECFNDMLFGGTVMTADAHNVLGVSGSAGGCPAGLADFVPAGGVATIVKTLADNGGPTQTHALAASSPALDAADMAYCPFTDQRGAGRPQVSGCDVGAFEESGLVVLSVNASTADGLYGPGAVIDIQVSFSHIVTVIGTPQLTLETGAIDSVVDYSGGSGTATLTFSYTVQPGDLAGDLDYASTSALSRNGGIIQDLGLVNAVLTLPTPGANGSLGAARAIVIDGVAPDTDITSTPADPSSLTSATFAFTGADVGAAGLAGFACALDGASFQACTSPVVLAGPLADGPHTFQVRASDALGSEDQTPATYTWTIATGSTATATPTSTATPTPTPTGTVAPPAYVLRIPVVLREP